MKAPFNVCLLTFAFLTGCDEGAAGEGAAVDSALVDVLVDLHLADARETAAGDPAVGDSLRRLALDARSLDEASLAERLDAVARRPDGATALAEAVEERLTTERNGASSE